METDRRNFWDFLKSMSEKIQNQIFEKLARVRQKYPNLKMRKIRFFKNQNGQFLKFVLAVSYTVARIKSFSKIL